MNANFITNFMFNITELFGSAVLVSLAMTPVIIVILLLRKLIKGRIQTRYTMILWSWVMAGVLLTALSISGGINVGAGFTGFYDDMMEGRYNQSAVVQSDAQLQGQAGNEQNLANGEQAVQSGVGTQHGGLAGQIDRSAGMGNEVIYAAGDASQEATAAGEGVSLRQGAWAFKDKAMQIWDSAGGYVAIAWLAGVAVMVGGMAVSMARLKRKVRFAVRISEHGGTSNEISAGFAELYDAGNINENGTGFAGKTNVRHGEVDVFECAEVDSSFVLGIVKPKIYVPGGIGKSELEMILRHEMQHIVAKDNISIVMAFLLKAIFWFNPVFWVYYEMVRRDIELYCDERSTEDMDRALKAQYSRVLLAYAVNPEKLAVAGFSSGESQVKGRVENVLGEKMKNTKARRAIIIGVVTLCAVLVFAGIGVASWYKGDGFNVNKKALITTSDVVRILENNDIVLEKDLSADASQYALTDIDASGNEYKLKPSVYIGKAMGDASQFLGDQARPGSEYDVKVLIYEMDHYVASLYDEYPVMDDVFPEFNLNNHIYNMSMAKVDGKNIRMIFMKTTETPLTDYETDEEISIYNEDVLKDYEGTIAMSALRQNVFEVLYEKAFNGGTMIYQGESENWRAMMPVEYFQEELEDGPVGYDTSSYADGYVLFQRKDGKTADAKLYSVAFESGGSAAATASSGFELTESEEYPGWYILKPLNYGSTYDRIMAGKQRYFVKLTDMSGAPETIVLVPEGTEYDWEKGKAESEAYKESILYKAAEPAVTAYLKKTLSEYIDVQNIEIYEWFEKDEGQTAQFMCNVVHNYYNKNADIIDFVAYWKERENQEMYEQYKEYYLSPKMTDLHLRVSVKDPDEIGPEVTVIPSTLESGVLCLYYDYTGTWMPIPSGPEWALNPYADHESSFVYEPGSKRLLHMNELYIEEY